MATIVIIEDTPANLELMSYLLEAFGHTVFSAGDGDEGLILVRRTNPELIICDVHLPKVDGYEVARHLKHDPDFSTIPLLAVTALAMVGDREKGIAAGFDGYLYKPIAPETFVSEVEHYLPRERHGISPMRHALTETQDQEISNLAHGKILVVDDTAVNRELTSDMLKPMGYDVWMTHSVEEAYTLACAYQPDLILSDLHMPSENGFSLFRRLQANPKLARIPFVLFGSSALDRRDYETETNLRGMHFLMRPIEPTVLVERIRAILGGNRE